MRKLIVQQYVTVDSIAAENDGGMSFMTGEPFGKDPEDDFNQFALKFLDRIDTVILGSTTYSMFESYWPNAIDEGEFGDKINALKKIVASTKLTHAPWGEKALEITPDVIETVRTLKQQPGKDIVVWGSLSVMKQLFAAKLVDEVELRICPTTRGTGVRMFDASIDMKSLSTQQFSSGIIVNTYSVS